MELTLCAAFLFLNIAIPLTFKELYPFSYAPMFCDCPRCYCDYRVQELDGRDLPVVDFGLHRTYWGNPPVGMGFRPAKSVDQFGQVATEAEIAAMVQVGFARHPSVSAVLVTRTVIGPNGETVGPIQSDQFIFSRATKP